MAIDPTNYILGSDPSSRYEPNIPFQRKAKGFDPTSLEDILGRLNSDFESIRGRQAGLEDQFLQMLRTPTDFSAFRGELSAVAEGLTNQLFGAGGAVELATRDAAGRSVESGFGPRSGGFDAARFNILGQASDQVADTIAQNAINLAPVAAQERAANLGALGEFTMAQSARGDNFIESLFGGAATLEQLGLAKEQFDLNRRLVEQSLKKAQGGGFWSGLAKIGGGLLGAVAGPAGAAVGSALGGKAVDWLGLGGGGNEPV